MEQSSLIPRHQKSEEGIIQNYRLKRARKERGLTGRDLAKMVGINPVRYFAIEELRVYPDYKTQERLSRVLKKRVDNLFPESLRDYCSDKNVALGRVDSDDVTARLNSYKTRLRRLSDPRDYPGMADFEMDSPCLQERINEVLETLKPREREIIEDRFGLNSKPNLTSEEISEKYRLSKKRVMEIKTKTISKIRHSFRAEKLRGFRGLR